MARRSKPSVQRYHDRVARRYDASYDDEYWQWHDTLTWDHLKPHLPADQARPVLDLGCGTGKWALKLAKSGYRVTCVDISGAMVERARRKFEELGSADRAEFIQADICDLSALPAASFSFAVALGEPLACAASPAKALAQIHRRLLPGGVLVASFDNRWAALDYYLQRGNLDELEEFLKTGRTHWLTRDADEQFPLHTHSPAQVGRLFDRAGFEMVDLIGKTILPMRHYRALLEEGAARRHLARLEKKLWRDPAAIGRAAHLQAVARKTAD